jgi:hypothetical protein
MLSPAIVVEGARHKRPQTQTPQKGSAVGFFAQARDTAQQEEEEEHTDHNLRKVTFERRKKGLCSSTKMGFMSC